MPVRSLIEFKVQAGAEDAFQAAYSRHGFLSRARTQPGFISGEFLRENAQSSTFWATALWQGKADYEAWQSAYLEVFAADELQALSQHLIAAPKGIVTEIVSAIDSN